MSAFNQALENEIKPCPLAPREYPLWAPCHQENEALKFLIPQQEDPSIDAVQWPLNCGVNVASHQRLPTLEILASRAHRFGLKAIECG
jgi:hypothetical protein